MNKASKLLLILPLLLSKQALSNKIDDLKTDRDVNELNWTDYPTATLTVIFSDQSTKVITDYGLQGTFGLSAVYSKMMKIGTEWK